jgi:hypothetical protein
MPFCFTGHVPYLPLLLLLLLLLLLVCRQA